MNHPAKTHFDNLKREGFSDLEAFQESFDYAARIGQPVRMVASGSHADFESFTRGFDQNKKERVRANWEFTD
jgi:hypothetical protein